MPPALVSLKLPSVTLAMKRPSTLTERGPSESSPSVANGLPVDSAVQSSLPSGYSSTVSTIS